jgi:large subunit ribosomal protein L16
VGFLTLKQLGAIRKYAKYLIKKQTKLWIKASAQFTITKKPNESRMGKGKASLKYWVSYQKKNRYLIEFKGLSNNSSITALAKKLSLKVLPKAKVY